MLTGPADSPCAPIVLFAYDRPDHLRRTVESLLGNSLAGNSDLIVYADAAPTPEKSPRVAAVRAYLATIAGFRSVIVRPRAENFGLARSIIEGVAEVLQQSERIIVLEDDMLTSPHFLSYMNEGLARYADDERVVSIHAYVYPVDQALPETYFLPGADCWGWATWRRGWACFNPRGELLLDELRARDLIRAFDFNGAFPYSRMLQDQIEGKNDSWAVRWYASAFLAGKLTLHPGRSLVHNIGNDDSGTHGGKSDHLDVQLSRTPILLEEIAVEASPAARYAYACFFRQQASLQRRLLRKTRAWLTAVRK